MDKQAGDYGDHARRVTEFTDTIMDQIRKLAELHAAGILTEEEFTAKKSELLSRL
ncbi:MAG: SHOCT domain-containing protein [Alphaproteobacteria bacterium]